MSRFHEIPLTGGNATETVQVGDTVHRQAGPWTPAVQRYLALCHQAIGAGIPAPLGYDQQGREVVSFVPGEVLSETPAEVLWGQENLVLAAQWLRQIHDASVDLVRADLIWRQELRSPREVVCHNDFAPYNMIVEGNRITGIIDFDMASPGPRIWDFAYLAYRLVPFAEDALTYHPERYGSRETRLHTLATAYRLKSSRDEILVMMAQRLDHLESWTREQATSLHREDLMDHAAMYHRDAFRLRTMVSQGVRDY